ncbi:MAG: ABC transporter permease subunit [Candidatus Atribacteria bacterium]|nr:ABC transporter permease subunit [Candidatus Atribacteria bacterium]
MSPQKSGKEMKSKLGSLFKNELKNSLGSIVLLLSLVILWDLYLYLRRDSWDITLVFILSFLPIIFLPFYSLVSGFYLLREEWQKKTIAHLLSLPVKGITLTSMKLLTIWIETIIFIVVIFIGVILFSKIALLEPIPNQVLWQLGLILSIISVLVAILSQFAYIVGRVFRHGGWLISIWTFFAFGWVIIRYSGLLVPFLSFVPNFQLNGWFLSGIWQYLGDATALQTIKIHGPATLAFLLCFFIVFLFGSWILEKHVIVPAEDIKHESE